MNRNVRDNVNRVYIAVSLDGYIAESDGGLDWLNTIQLDEGDDFGFSKFMSDVDAIVMGRKTFEQVLGFGEWPYNSMVYVLSTSLKVLPLAYKEKAVVVNPTAFLSMKALVEWLNGKGCHRLYVDGGRTIQSFLAEDLIDEMFITTIPILLGNGIPLFSNKGTKLAFEVSDVNVYNNQMVKVHYTRQHDV